MWKPAKDRWALGKPRKDSSTLVGHGQGQCQGVYLYKGGVKVPLSPRYATFPLGNAQIAPLLRFQSRSSTMFSYVGQGPCFCLVLSDKWSHFQLNLSRRQNGQNFGGPNICFDNFVSPNGRDRKIGVVPEPGFLILPSPKFSPSGRLFNFWFKRCFKIPPCVLEELSVKIWTPLSKSKCPVKTAGQAPVQTYSPT